MDELRLRGQKKASGFTLSEVLLAFSLLAITILTLIALSFYAFKAGQKSSNTTEAAQVAVALLSRSARSVDNCCARC